MAHSLKKSVDGMLISFNLASDAVYCAIEIQKKCKEQDIPLKIGIHEGEMVFEGADVLGDAVNVASRLESDTQEGCITISGSIYRDIKNRKDIKTKFIKDKKFKNVDESIKVYQVLCDVDELQTNGNHRTNIIIPKRTYFIIAGLVIVAVTFLFVWKSISPNEVVEIDKSIAVKPFRNLSTDKDNEHWVNGMMEDIRNNLAKIPELRVVSATTMEKYRDTKMTTKEISSEVEVSYLLEGSVQKVGDQLKIHAQLILAGIDDHIWQDTYIKDVSDVAEVFKIQSDIAQTIAKEIGMNLSLETRAVIESIPTTDLTAYDYYLKGEDYLNRGYKGEDKRYAMQMYNKAIELDSSYTLAWIGLFDASFRANANDERRKKIKFYLDYAIKLDSNLWEVKLANAQYLRVFEGKQDKAIQILKELKSQYPKNAEIYFYLGMS